MLVRALVSGDEGCALTIDVTATWFCTLYNQQRTPGIRLILLASKCCATSASSRRGITAVNRYILGRYFVDNDEAT